MMAENTTETLIGAVVLMVAAGFIYFATDAEFTGTPEGEYELTASFRSAEGIGVGTEVRMAGVRIGKVTSLELNSETYRAEAKISVIDGLAFSEDSQIIVSSEGLLGGHYVEIVPGGSPDNLGPGDEIEDTQGSVSFINLLMKFVGGGDK